METYKLLKNLRFMTRKRTRTTGHIRRWALDPGEGARYVRSVFEKVGRPLGRAGGWEGKRVLEIGPGDSLGAGLLALAHGASRYCAIDRFAVGFDRAVERRLFGLLLETLGDTERARVAQAIELTDSGYDASESRFAYFNDIAIEEARSRVPDPQFDVIFSNAVMEHVRSVEDSLTVMRELLAPGGLMFHEVDFRSHQRFEKHGLQFLEYSPGLWRMMTSHTGEPNRVRAATYLEILRRLGFVEIEFEVMERFDAALIRRARPRLAAEFRRLSDDELALAHGRLTARLPA